MSGASTDAVEVSTTLAVAPDLAFRLFTEEVDLWWKGGPRFRWYPERGGTLRFEPGVGGRFLEDYGDDAFEVGRVRVWEPATRLVFDFRARNFSPDQSTEVDVTFEAVGEGCRVTVVHSGWDAIAADHPARHGMDAASFDAMMGLWWADLLNAARKRAA
ncbi:MAG: SRPBCC domain-containing protein [Myxococcota bacterium]